MSRGELSKEQKSDSTLNLLFSQVRTDDNVEQGYFIRDGVLIRKWIPQMKTFLREPVVQIVIPTAFCSQVIKLAHGGLFWTSWSERYF